MVQQNGEKLGKKNANIKDFFKPFARAYTPAKRPLSEQEPSASHYGGASPPSKNPRLDGNKQPDPVIELSSSGFSALTPVASGDTPEPPSDIAIRPSRTSNASIQSAASSFGLPTLTSSQRIVKNGESVVRNSDDESGTDSSLAELDETLRQEPKMKSSSPLTDLGSSEPELPTPRSLKFRKLPSASGRTGSHDKKDISEPQKKYTFSLTHLLDRAEKADAEDTAYEKALDLAAEVEASLLAAELCRGVGEPPRSLNAETVAAKILPKDRDDADKVMRALQRTEALQVKTWWSFFEESGMAVNILPFPRFKGRPSRLWPQKPPNRELAILTGNCSDIAAAGHLPKDILEWIVRYCYFESKEDLRQGYLLVVEKAAEQSQELLNPELLSEILSDLGASTEALDQSAKIMPRIAQEGKSSQRSLSNHELKHFLSLLGKIGRNLSIETRAFLIHSLLCMSLDLALVSEAELLFPLHNAMQACLGDEPASISQPQMLASLEAIYRKVDSVQLQLQLTKTIPVATITCCTLRRRLALAFFFKDISYLTKDAPLLPELPQMAKFLRVQPAYTIKHSMDFHQLGTSMSLLDIGIDDGDRPSDPLDAAVERKFNKGVDELLEAIKYMSSRIVDSGASHMSRTEAKEVLVAMDSRLHYAVRTKPRPKKSVFGDVGKSGSSNFMRKFAIQSETAGNV